MKRCKVLLPVLALGLSEGDPECFGFGSLTYESCCLPPRPVCFGGEFSAERCCGLPEEPLGVPDVISRLRDELFTNQDPYSILGTVCGQYQPQLRYPDSHLTPALMKSVLSFVPKPYMWLEVGSYIGSSAITTAKVLKQMRLNCGVVCIDPFTGMVDMWADRKAFRTHFGLLERQNVADGPLLMDEFGHSRIYEMFLANVRSRGHQDYVLPLRVSSITGLRLLRTLYEQGRIERPPEVGSYIGSSAITTAKVLKQMRLNCGVVCIDPFTGMVDMWADRKAFRTHFGLLERQNVADGPLLMDEFGHSRIYEMFLANVRSRGRQDYVLPLRVSSITGLRLLRTLYEQGRIERPPEIIYLDSAHEAGETLLEVQEAWRLLAAPGVLFGDDWSWPGVQSDVLQFAARLMQRPLTNEELHRFDWPTKAAFQPVKGLAVVDEDDGAWMLFKEAATE